jgi:hypothetical protein
VRPPWYDLMVICFFGGLFIVIWNIEPESGPFRWWWKK